MRNIPVTPLQEVGSISETKPKKNVAESRREPHQQNTWRVWSAKGKTKCLRSTLDASLQQRGHHHHRSQRRMTRADLKECAEFNRDFLNDVRAAKTAGKTLEEVAGALENPGEIFGVRESGARAPEEQRANRV